jgi:YbbR domain-containing protein
MLDNLGVKLLCLVVAVVLWVQVADSIDVEEVVEVPLELAALPDSLVVRSNALPKAVEVRIRGTKLQIMLDDLFRRDRGRVELDVAHAHPGLYRTEIEQADVRISAMAQEILAPKQVEFEVYRRGTRNVPVRLGVDGQLPQGFTMASRPDITPSVVTVTGPEAMVNALSHVNTEPVRLSRRRSSFRQRVRLDSPDPDLHLHPVEVDVAVGIDEIVERTFVNVPISILSDMDPERLHVEPTAAQVRVMGAAGAVAALGPENVSVVLHIGELASGVYQLDPQVVVPDGIVSTSVDPASFQVIVADEAAADGEGAGPKAKGAGGGSSGEPDHEG